MIDDLLGKVEARAHFFEPSLFLPPILVTTGVPPADVVFVQVVAAVGEFLDDFGVGSAITTLPAASGEGDLVPTRTPAEYSAEWPGQSCCFAERCPGRSSHARFSILLKRAV